MLGFFIFGIIVWIGLPGLWLWAEFKGARTARLACGLLMVAAMAFFTIFGYQSSRRGIEFYLAGDYAATLDNVAHALRAGRGAEVMQLIDDFGVQDFDEWDYAKVSAFVDRLDRLAPRESKIAPR